MAVNFILASSHLVAGTGWAVNCKNINCILHDKGEKNSVIIGNRLIGLPPNPRIRTGGGEAFGYISGYCNNCKKIVGLSWPYADSAKQPPILGTIFDKELGCNRNLYLCSTCNKSMLAFDYFHNYKKCPICYTDNFSKTPTRNYD